MKETAVLLLLDTLNELIRWRKEFDKYPGLYDLYMKIYTQRREGPPMNNEVATITREHPLVLNELVSFTHPDDNTAECVGRVATIVERDEDDAPYDYIVAEINTDTMEDTGAQFGMENAELERYKRFRAGDYVMKVRNAKGADLEKPLKVRIAERTTRELRPKDFGEKSYFYGVDMTDTHLESQRNNPKNVDGINDACYDHQLDPIPVKKPRWDDARAQDEGWTLYGNEKNGYTFFVVDPQHAAFDRFKGDWSEGANHVYYWGNIQHSTYHQTAIELACNL